MRKKLTYSKALLMNYSEELLKFLRLIQSLKKIKQSLSDLLLKVIKLIIKPSFKREFHFLIHLLIAEYCI